jgi:hypothetical protein
MFEHEFVRELPIPPGTVFGWFTHDPGNLRKVLGEDKGAPETSRGTITPRPPHGWTFRGEMGPEGRMMVRMEGDYLVEPLGAGGSRLKVRLSLVPLVWYARLYLWIRPRKSRSRIEADYDGILKTLLGEVGPGGRDREQ